MTSARRLLQRRDMSKFGRLHTTTIVRIVKKLETDCSLVKNGRTGRPKSALSEKNVMRVKNKLESSPRRSTRTLSRELKLSQTAVWKILRKELKKFAYKIQMKQAQTQKNQHQRVEFSNIMSDHIEADPQFMKQIIFSDEAHFHLSGHVNRQNCRFWADENPHATVESPMTREKVAVWMGIGYQGIYGPYFFEDGDSKKAETIKTANYIDMLKKKFVPLKIVGLCKMRHPIVARKVWNG